jgi:hypothetical protein
MIFLHVDETHFFPSRIFLWDFLERLKMPILNLRKITNCNKLRLRKCTLTRKLYGRVSLLANPFSGSMNAKVGCSFSNEVTRSWLTQTLKHPRERPTRHARIKRYPWDSHWHAQREGMRARGSKLSDGGSRKIGSAVWCPMWHRRSLSYH